jgi:hypothetical protein
MGSRKTILHYLIEVGFNEIKFIDFGLWGNTSKPMQVG